MRKRMILDAFPMSFIVKVFVVYLPCVFLSGFFYFRVLMALRAGKQNRAKSRLSKCLFVLWLSWVLTSLPCFLFEFVLQIPSNEDNIFNLYWNDYHIQYILEFRVTSYFFVLNQVFFYHIWNAKLFVVRQPASKLPTWSYHEMRTFMVTWFGFPDILGR